jgi:hypothetical protein
MMGFANLSTPEDCDRVLNALHSACATMCDAKDEREANQYGREWRKYALVVEEEYNNFRREHGIRELGRGSIMAQYQLRHARENEKTAEAKGEESALS